MLSVCAAEPFPLAPLLEHLASEGEVASLVGQDLVVSEGGQVRMSAAVARRIQDGLTADQRAAAAAAALTLLEEIFPVETGEPSNWPRGEELMPHLLAAVGAAEQGGDGAPVATLLIRAASLRLAQGRFEEADALALRSVEAADAAGDPLVAGDAYYTRGEVLRALSRDEMAKASLERALQLHESAIDPTAVTVRKDRVALAAALIELDEMDAAEEVIDRAIEDGDDGSPDRTHCAALACRAWGASQRRRWDEAVARYEDAIAALERCAGPDSYELVEIQADLGVVQTERKEFDAARTVIEAAVELGVRVLGEDHPKVDVARSALASNFFLEDEAAAALPLLERIMENGERTLPPDHRGLWIRRRKLAEVLRRLGRVDEALAEVEAAIVLTEGFAGEDLQRLAGDLGGRAEILEDLGRNVEARDSYIRARDLLGDLDGADPLVLAAADIRLTRALLKLGENSGARRRFESALEIYSTAEETDRTVDLANLAKVELAKVSAAMTEEIAESCRALGRPDSARLLVEQGREELAEVLRALTPECGVNCALAIADAARNSIPSIALEALARAESVVAAGGKEDRAMERRIGGGWRRLGLSCVDREELDDALKAFEAALPLMAGAKHFEGVVHHDIADVYESWADRDRAIEHYRKAADLKREAGESPADLATTLFALGRSLALGGAAKYEGAREAFAECREIIDGLPEDNLRMRAALLDDMADLDTRQGRHEAAVRLSRQAVEAAGKSGDPIMLINTLTGLGRALSAAGDLEEALEAHEERLRLLVDGQNPDPQAEGVTLHDIASIRRRLGQGEEAVSLYREAAERKREAGQYPHDLAVTLVALARALAAQGDVPEAIEVLGERLDRLRGLESPEPRAEARTLNEIGRLRRRSGEGAEAIAALREAEAIQRRIGDAGDLGSTLLVLGRALRDAGDHEAALAAFEERLSILADLEEGRDEQGEGVTLHDVGDIYRARGELGAAIGFYRRAAEKKRSAGTDPHDLAVTLLVLGRGLRVERDFDAALAAFAERAEILAKLPERDLGGEAVTVQEVADVLQAMKRPDEALAHLQKESARLRADGADPEKIVTLLVGEANISLAAKDGAGAVERASRAAELIRGMPAPNGLLLSAVSMVAAEGCLMLDDAGKAAEWLAEADRLMAEDGDGRPIDVAIVKHRLAEALSATGQAEAGRVAQTEARTALGDVFRAGLPDPTMLPMLVSLAIDIEAPELVAEGLGKAREVAAAAPDDAGSRRLLYDVLTVLARNSQADPAVGSTVLDLQRERLAILATFDPAEKEAEGGVLLAIGAEEAEAGRSGEAIDAYRSAADDFRAAENPRAVAHALRLAAEVHIAAGEWGDAWRLLEERLEVIPGLAEDQRSRFEARTLAAMAKVRFGEGRADGARELIDAAIKLVEGEADVDPDLLQELKDQAGGQRDK